MMSALWAKFSGWIIGAFGVLAMIATVYMRGRSAGKKVEQTKAVEQELKEAREHASVIQETVNVQAEVSRLPASDVDERLRKWTRD